jgi:hypothetical protein
MTTKTTKKTAAKRKPDDWRAATLQRVREIIMGADKQIVEEVKWRKPSNPAGVPVWTLHGIICTGESYKQVVKLTFAKGAALSDPAMLFNSNIDGNVRRAIDIREGENLNVSALRKLVREAVALNSKGKQPAPKSTKQKPALLAGGNPQIAKAAGDTPVQAYIAAMPGWKREIGVKLDALITRAVPGVRKAVKWNSPFYGMEGKGWFASFHTFTNYVKLTFFEGTSLKPAPSGGQAKDARWINIGKDDLDEAQLVKWVKQAAKLPGWGKV